MLGTLKAVADRAVPGPYRWARHRWQAHRIRQFQGKVDQAEQAWIDRFGLTVQGGPFAGMRYLRTASNSALLPKLVGSYELELHATLAEVLQHPPRLLVDIGCAEGYYAVGMALRCPETRVLAFDSDPVARDRCRELAQLNGVLDRLDLQGSCTPETLARASQPGTMVICDVEGFELTLMDPRSVPVLASCLVLVELHPTEADPHMEALPRRLQTTHRVEVLRPLPRLPEHFPLTLQLPAQLRRLALDERRGEQAWLIARPKNSRKLGAAGD